MKRTKKTIIALMLLLVIVILTSCSYLQETDFNYIEKNRAVISEDGKTIVYRDKTYSYEREYDYENYYEDEEFAYDNIQSFQISVVTSDVPVMLTTFVANYGSYIPEFEQVIYDGGVYSLQS